MLPVSYSFYCCGAIFLDARRFRDRTGLVNSPPLEPQHVMTGTLTGYPCAGDVESLHPDIFQIPENPWLLCWTLFFFIMLLKYVDPWGPGEIQTHLR